MRPGNVPIANTAITVIPIQKLPVPIAYICIAKVNPHGKKNVNAPLPNVFAYFSNKVSFHFFSRIAFSFFLNNFPVGSAIDIVLILGDMFVIFTPSNNMTIPIIIVITAMVNGDKLITDPNTPNIHPKIPNQITLPRLNRRCGIIFCLNERFSLR